MATLKKITRSNPLSVFQQTAPGAGMASIFGALADTMKYATDYYMPGALEEMKQRGADAGAEAAGLGRPAGTSGSLTGDIGLYGDAIASIESKGSGDYAAIGPVTESGDRAYGRYQVMGANIPQWTQTHLGRSLTPEEFIADPAAQDAVFKGQFGGYVEKYGNPQDAASAWFTGRPLAKGGGSSDGYITGNQYVDKFSAYVAENPAQPFTDQPGGAAVRGVYDRMLADAPESVRAAVQINNDFRTPEQQAQIIADNWGKFDLSPDDRAKWLADVESMGAVEAGNKWEPVFTAAKRTASDGAGTPFRNWIALPGRSQHQKGNAADITFSTEESRQWFHENAGNYGAAFPLSNEPWHMEVAGARGGATGGPPAVATDVSGRTAPKLYSPYSGPLLRAYNAAAGVAYNAEVSNQAAVDLQSMVNNFPLDPTGFAQASKAYIDQVVSEAPAEFRRGLRESLRGSATKYETSLMAAQQTDTRNRAVNASTAMTERLSTQYAELLAAGDADGALAVSMDLREVLRARESIPGAGWTSEQSTNVMLNAQKAADGIIQRNATAAAKQVGNDLDLIIEAAKAGMTAADEGLLQDPNVWAAQPEKAAEAQAFVTLRNSYPEMFKLPPDVSLQMAETLRKTPADDDFDPEIAKAFGESARANARAWDEDPIKRASEVLDTKPAEMPEYVPGGEQAFVEWLKSRKEYGYTLRDNGYTDQAVFMTAEETKQFSLLLGKDMDPTVRGAMAGIIVAGLGNDAIRAFDALKVDDVTRYAGKMLAIGGNEETAMLAMQGQQIIAEKLVDMPTDKTLNAAFSADLRSAFAGVPGATGAQGEMLEFAKALYAAQAQGLDPASADKLMAESIQMALGQGQNVKGEKTGGIQDALGFKTLLPVGVTSSQVQMAFGRATGSAPRSGEGVFGMINDAVTGLGMKALGGDTGYNESIWRAANGVTNGPGWEPMVNGKPLDPALFGGDSVRLVAAGGPFYRMEIVSGATTIDVEDASGNVMMLNLEAMVEAAR